MWNEVYTYKIIPHITLSKMSSITASGEVWLKMECKCLSINWIDIHHLNWIEWWQCIFLLNNRENLFKIIKGVIIRVANFFSWLDSFNRMNVIIIQNTVQNSYLAGCWGWVLQISRSQNTPKKLGYCPVRSFTRFS